MATHREYPLLTAEDFLEIDFGERKAELDDGVIHMMAGGTARHAEVQGNVFAWLHRQLRGTGCRPYGSDMATQTRDRSVRYPDVSVFCRPPDPADDARKAFDDPRIVIEILSASTARTDLDKKLREYKALPSIDTIVFIDIAVERVRVVQRTDAQDWAERALPAEAGISIPSLDLVIPHEEIFARD